MSYKLKTEDNLSDKLLERFREGVVPVFWNKVNAVIEYPECFTLIFEKTYKEMLNKNLGDK